MEVEQLMDTVQHMRNKSTFKKNECFVNLSHKLNCNDFVLIRDTDADLGYKVAQIQQIFDNKAHVVWYIQPTELRRGTKVETENGSKIKFHENELIENTLKSENINLKLIVSKCTVFRARENESIDGIQPANENSPMAYICRYKLVRVDCFKLVPVDWRLDEEEMRDSEEMTDDENEQDQFTDADDQSENVLNLSDKINKLHESFKEMASLGEKTVSPIKIVNKQRVVSSRDSNSTSARKRSSPDANKDNKDVSPNKRNKSINKSIGIVDSPGGRHDRFESPSERRMSKIKKDLNKSFNISDADESSPYQSKVDENNPLKLSFIKGRVLRERNENSVQSPLTVSNESAISARVRRSILKGPDSAKNTPKRNVGFAEQKTASKRTVDAEATPSRRSMRMSSRNASTKISIAAEESSPEMQKPSTRKSIVKATSPPRTPKVASTRLTLSRTPKTTNTPKTPKSVMTPQQTRSLYRSGNLTPSIQSRQKSIGGDQTELEMVRDRLQVSAVPASLPCREREFTNIYEFITGKLDDGTGGCIYISGVPGTGKTATVTQVIKKIQSEMKPKKWPAFDYVDINGMRLTEPRQAYVQIYRQLTGKTLAWAQARDLLEARFTSTSKKAMRPTILLVDELDIICNRKQDVVYNLFDWTARKGSRLVAITIANTMDLPERVLKLKVASRLGLTRVTFTPYSFKQLQEVVMARLAGSDCFMADAVQLVARKVASVSGDCRRALDICRRATEIAEEKSDGADDVEVNFAHINQALSEMFASPKVRAIKNCTKFQKLFLQAVASEITRTGIEEVEFYRVYQQIQILTPILGIKSPPTEDQAMLICITLSANRLLIAEDSSAGLYQKIILNATVDDLYYALNIS